MCTTYEYQCHVQIPVILLHEFPIVLIGLLAVIFIEWDMGILLRKLPLFSLSVREVNDSDRPDTKPCLPIRCASAWFPVSVPPKHHYMILIAIGDQKTAMLGFP